MATAADVLMNLINQRNAREVAESDRRQKASSDLASQGIERRKLDILQHESDFKTDGTLTDNLIKLGTIAANAKLTNNAPLLQAAQNAQNALLGGQSSALDPNKFINNTAQAISKTGSSAQATTPVQAQAAPPTQAQGQPIQTSASDLSPFLNERDVFGDLTERAKLASKQAEAKIQASKEVETAREKEFDKAAFGAKMSSDNFKPFFGALQISMAEVQKDLGKDVTDATMLGFGLRQVLKAKTAFGLLPETKAFTNEIEAMATPLAKSAGEDRLTNEDIIRFTALLPSLLNSPSKENVAKMRNLINSWKVKGGDEAQGQRIVDNFLASFDEAGGILGDVASSIRSFDSDVKKAGKEIDKAKKIGNFKVRAL